MTTVASQLEVGMTVILPPKLVRGNSLNGGRGKILSTDCKYSVVAINSDFLTKIDGVICNQKGKNLSFRTKDLIPE